jgi:sulfite reductase (NADPH) hemoprotein beta-component
MPASQVPDVVETVVNVYLAQRMPGELFIDAFRRLGMTPFKEAFRDGQR